MMRSWEGTMVLRRRRDYQSIVVVQKVLGGCSMLSKPAVGQRTEPKFRYLRRAALHSRVPCDIDLSSTQAKRGRSLIAAGTSLCEVPLDPTPHASKKTRLVREAVESPPSLSFINLAAHHGRSRYLSAIHTLHIGEEQHCTCYVLPQPRVPATHTNP